MEACDALDGVSDGVIAMPNLCKFDPQSAVNRSFECADTGMLMHISPGAAQIASALWSGPLSSNGKFGWFGLNPDASPSGLANTACDKTGACTANPFPISENWIKTFILKDNTTDLRNMSRSDYDKIFRQSIDQYTSIISADNPDLTDFRDSGGKMITWHGLADELIPPNGTYDYYQRVLQLDPDAADYYRFFQAPGVGHCGGGPGWYPGNAMQSLVSWVERGIAPDILEAKSMLDPEVVRNANLCAYPKTLTYVGGDSTKASSFTCQ